MVESMRHIPLKHHIHVMSFTRCFAALVILRAVHNTQDLYGFMSYQKDVAIMVECLVSGCHCPTRDSNQHSAVQKTPGAKYKSNSVRGNPFEIKVFTLHCRFVHS